MEIDINAILPAVIAILAAGDGFGVGVGVGTGATTPAMSCMHAQCIIHANWWHTVNW